MLASTMGGAAGPFVVYAGPELALPGPDEVTGGRWDVVRAGERMARVLPLGVGMLTTTMTKEVSAMAWGSSEMLAGRAV
jgi:hypothetical protein